MRVRNHLKIKYVFIFLLPFYLLPQYSRADSKDGIPRLQLETKTAVIQYRSPDDLKKFNSKIKYSKSKWGLKSLDNDEASMTLQDKIIHKVDAIYARVQEILDMKKTMEKVTINLYSNRAQLNAAYFSLYQSECHIRAWYIYEYNAVYLNVADVHEGMLAHELAHAIIDHYLTVRPPPASAEILARYVDSHLHDR